MEDGFAITNPLRGQALSERQCGGGELERLIEATVQKEGIMLHADAACELTGAGVGSLAGFMGKGNDAREFFGAFDLHPDNTAHVWPVGGVGTSIISLLLEGDVGFVSGQVEIIAGVVITGGASEVGNAVDEGEAVSVFCEEWEVFAEMDLGGGGADGVELASVFDWCVGFHVPHVDVRGTSTEEEEDGRFRGLAPRRDRWGGGGCFSEGEPEAGCG